MFHTGIGQPEAGFSERRYDMFAENAPGIAADLAEQIGRRGYGEVAGLFSPAQIAEARTQAKAAVAAGGGYAGIEDAGALRGAILRDLMGQPALAAICRDLFGHVYGGPPPEVRFRQVLRCLSGEAGRHAGYFHYDSYAFTIIVPVAMPPAGRTGDLLLWPTARRVRRSYLLNVAEKFLVDRPAAQWLLGRVARRSRSLVRLRMAPGNLYVFCGYRALHTNEAVDADALRATLVLHCMDPHAEAPSKRLMGRARRLLRA